MKRYRWLLFDADGTLFDYDRAESLALREVFQLAGITFCAEHLAAYRRFNQAVWQDFEQGKISQDLLKVRRFELLLESIGTGYPAEKLSSSYLECLAGCSELVEDAAEVLQALQGRYRMAILTNGLKAVQRRRLAGSVIHRHIEELIISEEIGHAKPGREFFDAAFARLGQPSRQEALMIGDNWSSDILGAAGYGLDTCWYNPGHKPRPSGCEITREIASLRELTEWLA